MASLSLFQALLLFIISPIVSLLIFVIFVRVIMSWLVSFQIINLHNQFVAMIWEISGKITDPLVNPIRRFMPNLGGIDLSLLVLLLFLYLVNNWFIPGLAYGTLRLF
ncbi:YggT family protein [Oceanicaulis sp. AH-315-P02]|nr:YggT family protein [Robiginitomaculum sp.]MBN4047891.1 YggT family protein [Oceanicaulis sp. AH-315-P02]